MGTHQWNNLTTDDFQKAMEAAEQHSHPEIETAEETITNLFAASNQLRDALIVVASNAQLQHALAVLKTAFREMHASMEISTEIARARERFNRTDEETDDDTTAAEEETNEG